MEIINDIEEHRGAKGGIFNNLLYKHIEIKY